MRTRRRLRDRHRGRPPRQRPAASATPTNPANENASPLPGQAPSSTASPTWLSGSVHVWPIQSCYNFLSRLQGRTFGAPRLRPEPATRAGASNRGRAERPGTGDKRQGSPGVSPLRGGSFRRALSGGSPTARRAAAHGSPAPAAAGPRRHAPMPRHTSRARPSRSRRVRRSPRERSQATGTERRALSGSAPPASRAPQDPF